MEIMLKTNLHGRPGRSIGRSSDRGSVMVMAAIVSVIAFALAGVILAFADRQSTSSNNDRHRQHAIDAAMSGAVVANSALTTNAAYAASGLVTVTGGDAQFEVIVTADTTVAGSIRRILTSTGYAPSKAAPKSIRTLQQEVQLDPAGGFSFGSFSEGSYGIGSPSSVIGNIYSGTNITLNNTLHDYTGDLYARGQISTGSSANITGTLRANGNVTLSNGTSNIYGSVYSGGAISTGTATGTGTSVRDVAQAAHSITPNCGRVHGSCIPNSPPPTVPELHLPAFTYNAAPYSPAPIDVTASDFVARMRSQTPYRQGVFNITGNVGFSSGDKFQLTGDMTMYVRGELTMRGTVSGPAGQNVQLTLIVEQNASTNEMTIPSTVRTLIYTKKSFSGGNNFHVTGAIYAGVNITIGTNSSINYSPVSALGFDGPLVYSIRNITTREITSG